MSYNTQLELIAPERHRSDLQAAAHRRLLNAAAQAHRVQPRRRPLAPLAGRRRPAARTVAILAVAALSTLLLMLGITAAHVVQAAESADVTATGGAWMVVLPDQASAAAPIAAALAAQADALLWSADSAGAAQPADAGDVAISPASH